MPNRTSPRRASLALACTVVTAGCGFNGVNSLPLPGTVGRGAGAVTYVVEIANVGTLEPNAPVLIQDVVVGSVNSMHFENWHARITLSVEPTAVIPSNAVATVGQTSLLGSTHLALDPALGEAPRGRLEPNSTLPLNTSSTYPSTEETLSALSLVVNAGGLGQIGSAIHNLNKALAGRGSDVRRLLARFSDVVAVLDAQRDSINASIDALGRLSETLAGQVDVVERLVDEIRPALSVLNNNRANLVSALDKLGGLSDLTGQLAEETEEDLVVNLENLEPTLGALADVGEGIGAALAYATTYPFTQNLIDRGLHGDYMNEWAIIDLTYSRVKRTLLLGTRWEDRDAVLVPAPGDPYFQRYAQLPGAGTVPAPAASAPEASPSPVQRAGPILPVIPSDPGGGAVVTPTTEEPANIFAGPYAATVAQVRPGGG